MVNPAATRRHPAARVGKEAIGGYAAPLRIGWREMAANIAIGQRAQ